MLDPLRLDPEPGRLEGRIVCELTQFEHGGEHVGQSPEPGEGRELLVSVGREPHLGLGPLAIGAVGAKPRPRDEVAPVVEMEVRDRDRIHPGLACSRRRPSTPGPQSSRSRPVSA